MSANDSDHQITLEKQQQSLDNSLDMEIQLPKRFPYCIVWVPIPIISWLYPFIGHMGVCLSTGEVLDFGASYFINYDSLLFGNPARYLKLNKQKVQLNNGSEDLSFGQMWDNYLQQSIQVYQSRVYNFVGDNCHCFVAHFMNNISYANKTKWNMINLAAMMFIFGRYTGLLSFLYTWMPFAIILTLGVVFGRFYFLVAYVSLLVFLLIIFLLVTLSSQQKVSASARYS
eukprot:TRINITY_DN4821_c1_g1_i4.p1 TRINITY_DN4821_c1_g1~~TRINITY_DN4821_c1_g1_i4.p1  ORF type:complete len:228 (-),score=5.99 TRINITY_DN4821_c1_g1_i4:191-874(-)